MMERVAVLLSLHNAPDTGSLHASLGWWMAHHLAAGFSALLICETRTDHAETPEIVQRRRFLDHAASLYDIRFWSHPVDNTETGRKKGQDYLVQHIITQIAGEFSWILPLAIDEYFLPNEQSVQAFLSTAQKELGKEEFAKTDLLPVNWCICSRQDEGLAHWEAAVPPPSSSILHMPSPRGLYTAHAAKDLPDHRIARSFFRPRAFSTILQNSLPSPFMVLEREPDWHLGRILVDASASSRTEAARHYYHRPDIAYAEGAAFLEASQDIAAQFMQTFLLGSLYQARIHAPPSGESSPPMPFEQAFLVHHDAVMVLDHQTRRLTWRPRNHIAPERETCLCLAYRPPAETSSTPAFLEAFLYPESPLPWQFFSLLPKEQLSIADLLSMIPLRLQLLSSLPLPENQEGQAAQVAQARLFYTMPPSSHLREKPLSLLGEEQIQLLPVATETPTTSPFMALIWLTRYGTELSQIHRALAHLPWISASAFGAILMQHLATDAMQDATMKDEKTEKAKDLFEALSILLARSSSSFSAGSPIVFQPA